MIKHWMKISVMVKLINTEKKAVHCPLVSSVHQRPLYTSVQCPPVSTVYQCPLSTRVNCPPVSSVHCPVSKLISSVDLVKLSFKFNTFKLSVHLQNYLWVIFIHLGQCTHRTVTVQIRVQLLSLLLFFFIFLINIKHPLTHRSCRLGCRFCK